MPSVSNIQPIAAKEERSPVSHDKGKAASLFARANSVAQADMLLKGTGQYEKWHSICQKNGSSSVLAEKVATDIVTRHTMLEQAKQNASSVDWGKFDALTQSIAQHGIALHTSDQLEIAALRPSPSPKNHLPISQALMRMDSTSGVQPLQSSKPSTAASQSLNLSGEPAVSQGPAEEMVVNVVCGRYLLTPAMIALGNEKEIMLPLGEISRILEFNITSEPKTGKAAGWFLSADRTFSLDALSGQGSIEGKTISIPAEHIIKTQDEIYVYADTLSKWFPVDLNFDFTSQTIEVTPREELPFQTRAARRLSWKDRDASASDTPQLPRKTSEYQLVEFPVMDIGATGSARSSQNVQGNYYLHAKGDFARMNSELYLSGDKEDSLETARFTLKREDPDGNLLGPAHATAVEVGDIRVPHFPIVGGGEHERGARITNEPLHRSREYDSTFFEGNLAPGWDVEVYRNDVLLSHQSVGTDGRYSFDKVPLYYGANNFTLKFYGPQGEVRQEEKQIMVGGEMIKPGELRYELSASQKDENLLGVNEQKYSDGKGTGRFLGRFEYGLTPRLSLQGGVLSQQEGEKRDIYLHAGLRGSIADSYLSGDLVFNPSGGGYAAQILGQKKVGPLDLRLSQQLFQDFSTTGYPVNSNALQSRTTLSAFGRVETEQLDVPFSLHFSNSKRESGSENSAGANISTRIKNTYLNTAIDFHDWNGESEEADLTGSSSFTSEFKDLRLRGGVDYDLHPNPKLTSVNVSAIKKISDDISAELAVSHDMDWKEDNSLTTLSLGANVNNGKWSFSPSVAYDSDNIFTAAFMFNVALGSEPRTGKTVFSSHRQADHGAVSARVFHDKNNNKVFDDGDEPIENAKVTAVQSFRDAVTDEDGIAFVRGLPKNRPTDVALDTTTLEDPYWEPSLPGQSIVPRSGHVEIIDFPVTATGEIDGELSLRRADGTVKMLTHAPLQLVDENNEVVSETRSEYDGLYLFEKVHPGEYHVRLEPEFEKNLHVKRIVPIPVTISNDGNVVSANNLAFVEQSADGFDDTMIALQKKEDDSRNLAEVASHANAAILDADRAVVASAQAKPFDKAVVASSFSSAENPVSALAEKIDSAGVVASSDSTKEAAFALAEKIVAAGVVVSSDSTKEAAFALAEKIVSAGVVASSDSTKDAAAPAKQIAPIALAAAPDAVRSDSSPGGNQQYGYHLSSYKSMENALQGILHQVNKHKDTLSESDFTVQKTDLGPQKGIWYRVMARTAPAAQRTMERGNAIKHVPYTKIVSLQNSSQKGVHLTSLKTLEGAKQSIKTLQKTYPEALKNVPFSIVHKDLGQKGNWYRVVAGNFSREEQAEELSRKIKQKAPSSQPVAEKPDQLAHTGSYPSLERAVKGAYILAKQMGTAADQLSIRKVDLGPKGMWYRVALV